MAAGLRLLMFDRFPPVRGGTGSFVGCVRRWLSMASGNRHLDWCEDPTCPRGSACRRNTVEPCFCPICTRPVDGLGKRVVRSPQGGGKASENRSQGF